MFHNTEARNAEPFEYQVEGLVLSTNSRDYVAYGTRVLGDDRIRDAITLRAVLRAPPSDTVSVANAIASSTHSHHVCVECGGTVIEYDAAAGNGFCVACGTVVEENTIVNELTFGETSTGAAMVQGSFVAQGATHARMGGPFGNRGSSESREQTIANATRKIQQICSHFRLSDVVSLAATRLYTLALEHKFTRGRRSMHVVAVCVYVACRQKETRNLMLIDFSDLLQVNVFELGHTYLNLVRTLNLRLPPIDPSHHISRFASLLEFGTATPQVALDATRIVARMDRDWLARGRRPSGICGAALLIAARMNNFRRSVQEIVQVVKIADCTVRKRVEEFRQTGSAGLSVGDFRNVWLEDEGMPPAFVKGREREEKERDGVAVDEEGEEGAGARRKGRGKKRKRRCGEEDVDEPQPSQATTLVGTQEPVPIDPALLDSGILVGTSNTYRPEPLFLPEDPPDFPPPAFPVASTSTLAPPPTQFDLLPSPSATFVPPTQPATSESKEPPSGSADEDTTFDAALTEEVASFLDTAQTTARQPLDDAPRDILPDEALEGLDEDELDAFLLTEEEVRLKERVWVEMNREYLENLAAKAELEQTGEPSEKKKRKKRKTGGKPRDASTASGATAAESVRALLKHPRYSKRINYDALKSLFEHPAAAASPPAFDLGEQKTDMDAELWTLDADKYDGEGGVVEEGGGAVGGGAPGRADDGGEDAEYGYADAGGYAEWDAYEQEV
ncbi:hypothetical protein PHLGIDRAFT_128487 [Phlebiopsis gigantea 11061_1 CR5-6]|uniref:B-related factor 1 n=1 Tax=Phlebiopsis gigantea (strain 11061_1 CR5-6) TaxID=745531 RepID=A0A0C3PJ14_PHLG1|nr:hypothetical protein PHLGIDRAFT_128487 [Phlebiopsis gigantea 11061_1 CR5-6]